MTLSQNGERPRILVVEDNYLMAKAVCDLVRDCGFAVAGAVGRVDSGMQLLAKHDVDGAIVDINLDGVPSFPICDELARRNVPFFFLTGYQHSIIPQAFRRAPLLTKPIEMREFRGALTALAPAHALAPEIMNGSSAERGNLLLEGLPDGLWRLLGPLLQRVPLKAGDVLDRPGQAATHVYFPLNGVVAINARAGDRCIEVALVGREGATGIGTLLGDGGAANEAVVHFPGEARRIDVAALVPLLHAHRGLHEHLLRYANTLLAQVSQTALAIGHARIEQRLARWLLMAADRFGSDRIDITHEALSRAFGVRRAGITVSLHLLESKGAFKSERKLVRILDRAMLVQQAVGFYEAPRGQSSLQ